MTLGYRQVIFNPLVLDGVTAPGVATGVIYRWRPTTGYDDGTGTGYVERIWSRPLVINGVAATRDLPVTPSPLTWAVEVMVEVLNDGLGKRSVRVETVVVPAGGTPVEFETLQRVDPATLTPNAPVPSGIEIRVRDLETIASGGGLGGGGTGGAPAGTGTGGRYRVGDLEDITPTGRALALVTGVDTATAQANARAIIGAGTSNLAIGTTASTAAPGTVAATVAGLVDLVNTLQATVNTLTAAVAAKADLNAQGFVDESDIDPRIARTADVGSSTAPEWSSIKNKPNVMIPHFNPNDQAIPRALTNAGPGDQVVWYKATEPSIDGTNALRYRDLHRPWQG